MAAPTMSATSLLTEHLGYPPISLVDDLINSVNEIMYKCTQAMETYLRQRHQVGGEDFTEEIKVGTAKLETLLENAVDKNLDKLELYVLRNVLSVPAELVEGGHFRLAHYDKLVLDTDPAPELRSRLEEIEAAFALHDILLKRVRETRRAHERIVSFKEQVRNLLENGAPSTKEEAERLRALLGSLRPVDETMKLLAVQLRALYTENEAFCSADSVEELLCKYSALHHSGATRSGYIHNSARTLLRQLFGDAAEDAAPDHELSLADPEGGTIDHPNWDALQKHV
ncbi:ADR367Cp [Eremothecium gossypii ATCC 10895]|uniref:ADR367Cp n=1 Tax=Eremothecium gossypii (strain ATCC 10895 / CBS 109.51 / FGSC 9923 / NRRL Y-1056) TaxID=284811 RepID=Q759B0_EREGS|nr:ADR367Cp [Eremothecium gossypii ATCC 10895]AAS52287.1 ADR367Cp [Eremothecium gossypii ATCC 10895]AEY96585.1 FADR367Cp [Eremothecium gossypii FDAG1]